MLKSPSAPASETSVRDAALQSILQWAHATYQLLHGRVQLSLDEVGVCAARARLAPVIADLGARLSPHGWAGTRTGTTTGTGSGSGGGCGGYAGGELLSFLHNPVALDPGCPLLPVSRSAFLIIQSMLNAVSSVCAVEGGREGNIVSAASAVSAVSATVSAVSAVSTVSAVSAVRAGSAVGPAGSDKAVVGTCVFYEGYTAWSSLDVDDTRALAQYAARCLVPGTTSTWRAGVSGAATGALGRRRSAEGGGGGNAASSDDSARVRYGQTARSGNGGGRSGETGSLESGGGAVGQLITSGKLSVLAGMSAAVRTEATAGVRALATVEGDSGDSGFPLDTALDSAHSLDSGHHLNVSRPIGGSRGVIDEGKENTVEGKAHVDFTELSSSGQPPFMESEWGLTEDGFLRHAAAEEEAEDCESRHSITIHLRDGVKAGLVVMRQEGITLVIFLRHCVCVNQAMRSELAATVTTRLAQLHAMLAAQLAPAPPFSGWHVPGFRYLYVDRATLAVRASPEGKAATLSADSLVALSLLRADLDSQPAGAGAVHEVCIRAHHDAWMIARRSGEGRELFVVLERAGDTLLQASEAVNRFGDVYFEGIFHAA